MLLLAPTHWLLAFGCLQLDLEWYFRDTAAMSSLDIYWIGLYKSPLYYYWADGTNVGNGVVSNADPYAHWWANAGAWMAMAGLRVPHASCPFHSDAATSGRISFWRVVRFLQAHLYPAP